VIGKDYKSGIKFIHLGVMNTPFNNIFNNTC